MEKILNILHYCIYIFFNKLHFFSEKINPFNLLHRLPFQKRRYKKLGIDIDQVINQAFNNEEFGFNIMYAGGMLVGILFIFIFSILISFKGGFNLDFTIGPTYFLIMILMAVLPCYFFVFKKDKYLIYFKKFKNWTKYEKRKYGSISFLFVIFVIFLFFLSLTV